MFLIDQSLDESVCYYYFVGRDLFEECNSLLIVSFV